MDKHDISAELAAFRQQIDALDDRLAALLQERIGIIGKVGEMKRRHFPGVCPIRPGREAEQVRRMAQKFIGSAFPPVAAASLWRTIIGASCAVESDLAVSVYAPDKEDELFWLAREYFGPSVSYARQPHVKRVIGDIMDDKAAVGVIPMLRSSDTTYWWTNLVQPGSDMPKIFAHIPFVYANMPGRGAASALAIARIAPEPSGDDRSLFVVEADSNASQHRLQTAFAGAGLDAAWINIATLSPATRHHLIELSGFVTLSHVSMQHCLASLGPAIFNASFLGAYAVPMVLSPETASNSGKPIAYAPAFART